jgi:hypothetical protein
MIVATDPATTSALKTHQRTVIPENPIKTRSMKVLTTLELNSITAT